MSVGTISTYVKCVTWWYVMVSWCKINGIRSRLMDNVWWSFITSGRFSNYDDERFPLFWLRAELCLFPAELISFTSLHKLPHFFAWVGYISTPWACCPDLLSQYILYWLTVLWNSMMSVIHCYIIIIGRLVLQTRVYGPSSQYFWWPLYQWPVEHPKFKYYDRINPTIDHDYSNTSN